MFHRTVEKAPVGRVFARLTVTGDAVPRVDSQGKRYAVWQAQCVCGNLVEVVAARLKQGDTKSCGCLKKGRKLKSELIHTSIDETWQSMCDEAWQSMTLLEKLWRGK